ncbi:Terpenoid synthase [Macrophomina phaseolina MS6]|uniref:Terpenoid synthase n=1 Tax=Macrophomina phaseolina (strain MS6) TaxID=1126212 RepID=K2RAW2_MACPH|nr:Terpenoid synthase [Macrophomina phaseolina MS6]
MTTVCKPDLSPLEIRASIGDFLERCGLFLQVCPKHTEFAAECIAESDARGYLIPQNGVFKNFIPAGVAMARNAYAHQPHEVQMFISLYTAFLVYLDDMFENDMDAVRQFNHKFISRKPQKLELLDHFAELLHEMPALFGSVVANIMTTSTLNLVTALSIEHEVGGVILEPSAHRFPTFSRVMSGASETYALFMFPSDEPLRHILQALPDCMTFINNGK